MCSYFESRKDRLSYKLHNLLIPAFLTLTFYGLIACGEWNLSNLIQYGFERANHLYTFPIDIDKTIPIIPFFAIIYSTSTTAWYVIPLFIYLVYGKERYSKLLGVATFVYLTSFIIKIIFPVSTEAVQQYGLSQMELIKNRDFCEDIVYQLLKGRFVYAGFPSNHCSDTLLLLIAIVDFNFFDKTQQYSPHKLQGIRLAKQSTKIIWTTIFGIYTTLVCMSTFILKVHYVFDWIPALVNCLSWYLLFSFFPRFNIFKKLWLEFIINYQVACGYMPNKDRRYSNVVTWGRKYWTTDKLELLDKHKFIKHYVLADALTIFIGVIIILYTATFGTIILKQIF